MSDARAVIDDLRALAEGRLAIDAFVTWIGGAGAGTDGDAVALPWPRYTERAERVWPAFEALGFDPDAVIDHVGWAARFGDACDRPAAIAAMSEEDLRFQIVRFRRGERFCDGWWAGLIESGAMLAALLRAEAARAG